MTDARAEFEAWFASVHGPTPPPEWALANLAAAAVLEATKAGAWAAWECRTARRAEVAQAWLDDPDQLCASGRLALEIVLGVREGESIDEVARCILGVDPYAEHAID